MPTKLTIVVGGYIVGFPLGGMTWHHLNYLLGLHELGHDVWFLEDSGPWGQPFNPAINECRDDPTYGLDYLTQTLDAFGLPRQYCYYSQMLDRHFGLSRDELHDLLRRADLLLCVSGVTPLPDDRPRPRCTAVIDTDPVLTQLRMRHDAEFLAYFRAFDHVATFGTLVGTDACPLPTHGLRWLPTRQPIALGHWPVTPTTSRRFTTVGRWEHHHSRDVEFDGRKYRSIKSDEWRRLIDLPARVPFELEMAMQSLPPDVEAEFAARGWRFAPAYEVTASPQSFRSYIQRSAGELTVAKQIYAGIPSGWFSDRSAAYLAAGRPVVTQDTGFERWLPTGEGLFAFRTPDDAATALDTIATAPAHHAAAARRVAEEHFDAPDVLADLLERVLS